MKNVLSVSRFPGELSSEEITTLLDRCLKQYHPTRRVLIVPPDFTRFHSGAGFITTHLYSRLHEMGVEADILPALGTHAPMLETQLDEMYPGIPHNAFFIHNWRSDVTQVGIVPASFVHEVSEGLVDDEIPVEVNRRLLSNEYDLVLSVGQVVPHEVVGMANYNKNLFVGLGGSRMINASHMLGAFYGMERIMGRDHTPVRRVFDYAEEHFLSNIPLCYLLTVTTNTGYDIHTHGLFIGRSRAAFEQAVELSRKTNVTWVEKPIRKCIVCLPADEFHSCWLGNKAIYRTRMAMAQGGELIVLAPGVEKFGEDDAVDAVIRRYGYCGRDKILRIVKEREDLKQNLSAAAHLIHGSPDGRFTVTYAAPHLTRAELTQVGFDKGDYDAMISRYSPETLKIGFQTMPDGEEIYFIPNPALGLWMMDDHIV